MMASMLRCVERMGRHILRSATCTRRVFHWPTLECVDLSSVVVKSVEMTESHTSLRAMQEHMVPALTTQESALLKSKSLIILLLILLHQLMNGTYFFLQSRWQIC